MKEEWQIRMEHAKVIRDTHVKCGHCTPPTKPDTEGSLGCAGPIHCFNGPVFYKKLREEGNHDQMVFEDCKCHTQVKKTFAVDIHTRIEEVRRYQQR